MPSHSYIAKYTIDYFLKYRSIPTITPYWYNGFELLHNPPPLIYLPLSLIYLLVGDIALASRIFTWLTFCLLALSIFIVIRRKYGSLNAMVGALIYPFVPIIYWQGIESYTRGFSLIFYPLSLYFVDDLVEKKENKVRNVAILAVLVALTFLTHPMMGIILIIFFTIYLFVRLIFDKTLKKFSLFLWIFSVVLGLGLISWYLLPYFAEARGWSTLPESIYQAYTPELSKQIILLSISLFALSFVSIILNRANQRLSLFVTALISMIFALGSYIPIWSLFPLIKDVYPLLILTFTGFLLTYVVATTVDFRDARDRILPNFESRQLMNIFLILIFVGLPFFESARFNAIFSKRGQVVPSYEKKIAKTLSEYKNDGRVIPMKYPFSALLPVVQDAEKAMVEGRYNSATPMGKQIAWLYDALDNSWYNYVFKKLSLYNTRFLLKTEHLNDYQQFLDLLDNNGFNRVYRGVMGYGYDLYYKNKPSNYFIPLEQRFLVIGKYAMVASSITDSSVQGGSVYIDDYDLETLKLFDGIILYGFTFRDKGKAEALISNYAASGGKVVIDLLGYESPLEENPSFLGVMTYNRTAEKDILLNTQPDGQISQDLIPNYFPLPSIHADLKKTKFKEWRYVTYYDLDVVLAKTPDNLVNGAIGYKQISGQKIWFLGPNYFYHTFASHNAKQMQFLKMLIDDGQAGKQLEDYKIYDEQIEPENIKFNYESSSRLPLFASFTFSPHWRAYLNGNTIDIINLEDLIFLDLPAGKGRVDIRYESTPVHFYGKALTILTLLLIGALLYNERYNNILYRQFTKRRRKAR